MDEEHTPTIIQLILSADLAVIQLKDSHLILYISQQFFTSHRKSYRKQNAIDEKI